MVQSDRQGMCTIVSSSHAFQTNFQINDNPSFRHCYFLSKFFSSLKTRRNTVQHQRPHITYNCNCCVLKEVLPPPVRQICPVTSRGLTQNTISIHQTVGVIVLGPQNNLRGGYFFSILLAVNYLWCSDWTPVNITEDIIELYDTFNTKGCPDKSPLAIFVTYHSTQLLRFPKWRRWQSQWYS